MLAPGTEIFIKGRVKDQFGQVRLWDNATWVSAKIEVKGSNGATLSGGKVNITKEGEVEFRKVRRSKAMRVVNYFVLFCSNSPKFRSSSLS